MLNTSRRNFLRQSSMMAGALILPDYAAPLNWLFPAAGQMKPLRNNVGVYTNRGGTIAWMISKKGIVVVDTQFPAEAADLVEQIRKQNQRPVDLLINTHHHGDHSGGNIAFKGIAKKVLAHKNSKINQENVAREQNKLSETLLPDATFDKTWSEKVGKERMTLHYFGPGHTNGDALIHFEKANVVHMGDLVFNRRYPFVDKKAGASVANWITVLETARKTFEKDTIYVFGHAFDPEKITGTAEDLKAFENYLSKLLEHVQKSLSAGMSKEEILKTTSIPGAEEWQGQGIERSLSAALEELGGS